jgi:hypothetical protein
MPWYDDYPEKPKGSIGDSAMRSPRALHPSPTRYQADGRLSEDAMTSHTISRRTLLVVGTAAALTLAGGLSGRTVALADESPADKDYIAVFGRTNQPIAVIEKPKGVPTGRGTNFEIEAFPLRVEPIDATQARAYVQRLTELDRSTSRILPDGFRVYADRQAVELSFASAAEKYRLTVADPADGLRPRLASSSDCDGM